MRPRTASNTEEITMLTPTNAGSNPNTMISTGIYLANVPDQVSLLAFGIPPAREAESAGGMTKVPKGQGLAASAR